MASSEISKVMDVIHHWKSLFEKVDSIKKAILDLRNEKENADWVEHALRDERPSIKLLIAEYTKAEHELKDFLVTKVRLGEAEPICGEITQ